MNLEPDPSAHLETPSPIPSLVPAQQGVEPGLEAATAPLAVLRRRLSARSSLKAAIGLIVLVALCVHVIRVVRHLGAQGVTIRPQFGWLVLSGVVYLLGLGISGYWYARVLAGAGNPLPTGAAVRAYLVSHIGKYVPGKAFVVILRVWMGVPFGARVVIAAFATLYETLVMMAAGGLVAACCFLGRDSDRISIGTARLGYANISLGWLSLAFALGFLVLAGPAFRRLTRLMSVPFPSARAEPWPRVSPSLLPEGLLWTSLTWLLLGYSQVLVLRGLGLAPPGLHATVAVVGSVALATVVGFVIPIAPGGLGVREWVLWTSLGAALDHDWAVVASLALRLVWVVAEVLVASVLLACFRPSGRRASGAALSKDGSNAPARL